eukprot:CAMPEP_0172920296 /NCGR_PEP_ID=MMETSP1075-20121228/203793_1 /TAXON_ID=2916 /ORGANISM="Ceratium fusus, Strain PA161109" /LENGTH=104 /DNA_ID=CAMNT_0013780291 /DNA_START=1079 /DNA_END=1390 /DNA_ORIENTATION=+
MQAISIGGSNAQPSRDRSHQIVVPISPRSSEIIQHQRTTPVAPVRLKATAGVLRTQIKLSRAGRGSSTSVQVAMQSETSRLFQRLSLTTSSQPSSSSDDAVNAA